MLSSSPRIKGKAFLKQFNITQDLGNISRLSKKRVTLHQNMFKGIAQRQYTHTDLSPAMQAMEILATNYVTTHTDIEVIIMPSFACCPFYKPLLNATFDNDEYVTLVEMYTAIENRILQAKINSDKKWISVLFAAVKTLHHKDNLKISRFVNGIGTMPVNIDFHTFLTGSISRLDDSEQRRPIHINLDSNEYSLIAPTSSMII